MTRSTIRCLLVLGSVPFARSFGVHSLKPKVILDARSSKAVLSGSLLVFDKSIQRISGMINQGDYVDVVDEANNPVGKGFYNGASMYRVRIVAHYFDGIYNHGPEEAIRSRIEEAIACRSTIGLPSPQTDAYRLINGEGDKLSGLIVDILGNTAVVQSGAFWIERHRNVIENVLKENGKIDNCIWNRLEQRLALEGIQKAKPEIDKSEHNSISLLPVDGDTVIVENGIKYRINPVIGQKTGFYCDQRDNRLYIRSICRQKEVLDLYCYVGGFGINAAIGGASTVTAVDSSLKAIAWAKANAALNNVDDRIEFICEDSVKYMNSLLKSGKKFDVVICDPPKLAPSHKDLRNAMKKYIQINEMALKLVNQGGILVTCSCSGVMATENNFHAAIESAAMRARKSVRVLQRKSAAECHPVDVCCPESNYLTVYVLYVA